MIMTVLGGMVLGGLALAGPIGPATPAMAAGKDPALAAKLATVMKDSRVTKGRTAVSVYDTTLKAEVFGRNPSYSVFNLWLWRGSWIIAGCCFDPRGSVVGL